MVVFLFSSLIFIYPLLYKKSDKFIRRKNLFIILNFIILFILISTLTLTAFKFEDFILVSPLYAIIIGWSLYTITKKLISKFHLYGFLIFMILIFMIFVKNMEIYDYALEMENFGCVNYGSELSLFVNKMNCSNIITDINFLRDFLWWHIFDKEFYPLSFEYDSTEIIMERLNTYFKEGNCYIFTLKKCQLTWYREQYLKTNQTFSKFIEENKITIINEKTINSKEGDELFKIYKIS